MKGELPLRGIWKIPKLFGLIGCEQAQVGRPLSSPIMSVADTTPGSLATSGTGGRVYTTASKPCAETNCGNAFSVRWPAAVAAKTIAPAMLMSTATASHERHRCRTSARNASATAPKTPSLPSQASVLLVCRGRPRLPTGCRVVVPASTLACPNAGHEPLRGRQRTGTPKGWPEPYRQNQYDQ